jgi:hypothetical protein
VVKFASTKREEIIEVHSAVSTGEVSTAAGSGEHSHLPPRCLAHIQLVQRLQDEKMRRLDYAVRAVGTSQARQVVVDEEVMRETTRKAAT